MVAWAAFEEPGSTLSNHYAYPQRPEGPSHSGCGVEGMRPFLGNVDATAPAGQAKVFQALGSPRLGASFNHTWLATNRWVPKAYFTRHVTRVRLVHSPLR